MLSVILPFHLDYSTIFNLILAMRLLASDVIKQGEPQWELDRTWTEELDQIHRVRMIGDRSERSVPFHA